MSDTSDREPNDVRGRAGGWVDHPEHWRVTSSETTLQTGHVISVRKDHVVSPADGAEFPRDVVLHPGAVGIVALDDQERVLTISQYRHPTGHRLVEIPAGLLDVAGEGYPEAAQRELYEEGAVRARRWHVLADVFTSPGMTNEATRVFLARDITVVADEERHVGQHEEADMPTQWVPLDELVTAILAGDLQNQLLVTGVLAAWAARHGSGYDALRSADAPWPARHHI
ncbi:MAG TPA: NUDIX hydrolase [Jiangellaceae bacterium]|nr:NUDIX hydrolase [Jiangellaceae bacterium]